jgi:hypothetical protein
MVGNRSSSCWLSSSGLSSRPPPVRGGARLGADVDGSASCRCDRIQFLIAAIPASRLARREGPPPAESTFCALEEVEDAGAVEVEGTAAKADEEEGCCCCCICNRRR